MTDTTRAADQHHWPISPTALVLALAWIAAGAALGLGLGPVGPVTFVFVLTGWILALIAHEFGHAFVAWKGGDHTIAERGYLTLDPLRYLDPFSSIILPVLFLALGGIGFPGGAVWVRTDLIRTALWRSATALAGPAGTLIVMLFLALMVQLSPAGSPLAPALAFLAYLQGTALILNLLPVPGLDGYGALAPFIPEGIRARLRPLEAFAIIALMAALLWLPLFGALLFTGTALLAQLLGVQPELIVAGFDAFRFWR